MSYLVRKLIKYESILQIGSAENIKNMPADAVTSEFRTKDGALSTWEIKSIEEFDNAALAIIITSSKVDKMDFIAIDTKYLEQEGLIFEKTYAGQDIAIPDLQDTHYDIKNITITKLINCANVYKRVFQDNQQEEKYIVRYVQGEIYDLLKRSEKRIKEEILNSGIKKFIKNYKK